MATFLKNETLIAAVVSQVEEVLADKSIQLPKVFMLHDLMLKGLQKQGTHSTEDINGALKRLGSMSSGRLLREHLEFTLAELRDSTEIKVGQSALTDICLGSGSTTSWSVNGVKYSGYFAVPVIIYEQTMEVNDSSYLCDVILDDEDEDDEE